MSRRGSLSGVYSGVVDISPYHHTVLAVVRVCLVGLTCVVVWCYCCGVVLLLWCWARERVRDMENWELALMETGIQAVETITQSELESIIEDCDTVPVNVRVVPDVAEDSRKGN